MEILARIRKEDGFSLIELLVVMLIMGFVLGAMVMVSSAGQKLGVRDNEQGQATRSGQTATFVITRDLRQATQIMPTGVAGGTCSSTATASCIDFLIRTRAFNAAQDHVLQRVRIDCTQPYIAPKPDPYAGQYRSCKRYMSTNPAQPATALAGSVVARVLNWDTTSSWPIFSYRKTDPTQASANGWIAANPSTDTTSSDAQRINVTLQIPSRGESGALGNNETLLLQDAAELRNILP